MTTEYEVIQDTVLAGTSSIGIGASAQVAIRDADSAALVTLFQDRLGASGETNPFNADASGQFRVYTLPGRLQITVVHNSVTRIWENYRLGNPLKRQENVIINGSMVFDQRDTDTTPVTANNAYGPDRWKLVNSTATGVFDFERDSATPADGFPYYLACAVTTNDTAAAGEVAFFQQMIEGYNIARFGFGQSWAKVLTLSFWVRSSLTGIYCVAFQNSASNRSYVVEYTINDADTWEYKTITLTANTSGTWLTVNGIGLRVNFDLGSGSNLNTTANIWTGANKVNTANQVDWIGTAAATFWLTGVQLELGPVANGFDHVDYAKELAQCKRYYEILGDLVVSNEMFASGFAQSTTVGEFILRYSQKRALPNSVTLAAFGTFSVAYRATATAVDSAIASSILGRDSCRIDATFNGATLTLGDGVELRRDTSDLAFIKIDAEL